MKHKKSIGIKPALLLLLVFGAAAGCGYKLSGGGTMPDGAGMVCITIFNNRSSEVKLENTIANDLIYEFTRNGQKVSKTQGEAGSVMTGEIKSVKSDTVTRTGSLTSIETRVTVTLGVRLKNHQGKVLWENNNITGSQVYTVDSDNTVDSAAKTAALEEISDRFASTIYSGLTEDF